MPPVSDPNYFTRRANSGPERDNPLAPDPAEDSRNSSPFAHGGYIAVDTSPPLYESPRHPTWATVTQASSSTTANQARARLQWLEEVAQRYTWIPQSGRARQVEPEYVPINTIRERVAMIVAGNENDPELWARRSERDRERFRERAARVLRLVPMPEPREES